MRHILRFALSLLFGFTALLPSSAESDPELWSTYFAYADPTAVVEAEGRCYALMNGNLMSYDPQTTEVRCYDNLNSALSSKDIALMGYCTTRHTLVLVYADGNIDLLDVRNDKVVNIPHFRDNPDKNFELRNLNVQDDDALLCTAEGVIWISLVHNVIVGQYPLGGVRAAAIFRGDLYASLDTPCVKRIDLRDNPNDLGRWEVFSTINVTDMTAAFGYLYLASPYLNEYAELNEYGFWLFNGLQMNRLSGSACSKLRRGTDRVITWQGASCFGITKDDQWRSELLISQDPRFLDLYPASDGSFWGILPEQGIVHGTSENQVFTVDIAGIKGDGPSFEHPYSLSVIGSDLFVVGGVYDCLGVRHFPYNVARLDADGNWHTMETPVADGRWIHKRAEFQDATSIAQDPRDPSHYFVTTYRNGIFEYRGEKLVAQYTEGSGAIASASSQGNVDYVRTNSAIFDADGNLFVTNMGTLTSIWCRTPKGEWLPFYNPKLEKVNDFGARLIDRKGRLWLCQHATNNGLDAGFLCLDYNGTPANTSDDVYTYRTSFLNQDGTPISISATYCIAEDRDGRIWMGTAGGVFVVDDPDRWGDSDFLITQVKVPRNDGTNYADYLLAGAPVTAIAVDGANRKWIGTNGDGVYVVSPDGTVILNHFTPSNSPLVSGIIWSLAYQTETGDVFIGTDKGLMSCQSRSSDPADELISDNVRIYPNPVRPDFDGLITIDGLVYDCDVKIVSLSGHVVAAGTSQGGTFLWDGRGFSGQRVGTGVYYVMMAAPGTRETAVGKIAVIR